MATFAFEKLVRDKTEQRMQDPEVTLFKKQLSELEYKKELCKKKFLKMTSQINFFVLSGVKIFFTKVSICRHAIAYF